MNQDLGSGARLEPMALGLELRAKLAEAVDLAVGDGSDGPGRVADGLMATLDVDDAQAADTQCEGWIDMGPLVTGPAVHHRCKHSLQRRPALRPRGCAMPACYAA